MPDKKPGRQMKNLRPYFISIVDKAANRREFLMRKDADGSSEEYVQVPIFKRDDIAGDEDTRYITGVVYEPGTIDTQGDCMTAVEIEKAAHRYMRDYQGVDVQHSFKPADGCFVAESTVHKAATTIAGNEIPEGAWTITIGIENPEIIAKVDSGELNGLSIGGVAQYELMKKDDAGPASDDEAPGWFRKFIKSMFGKEKESEPKPEEPKDNREERKLMTKSELQDVYSSVTEALIQKGVMTADDTTETKTPDSAVAKNDAPTQTDLAGLVAKGVAEGLAEVMKAAVAKTEPPAPAAPEEAVAKSDVPEAVTTGDLQAIIKSAVSEAVTEKVAPIEAQVNKIAAAYNVGAPSNLNGMANVQKNAEPHYMDGVFSA